MNRLAIVQQRHLNFRMRECDSRERLSDVSFFRLGCSQKLLTHRRVVKQLTDFDGCSSGTTTWLNWFSISAVYHQLKTAILVCGFRTDHGLADLSDRSQRFSAKPKRSDSKQIIRVDDFTSRVTGNRERQLILRNPTSVVGNAN